MTHGKWGRFFFSWLKWLDTPNPLSHSWKEKSRQFIATSHDLTPNGGLVREIPLFQGNLGWWNIIPFGQKNTISKPSFFSAENGSCWRCAIFEVEKLLGGGSSSRFPQLPPPLGYPPPLKNPIRVVNDYFVKTIESNDWYLKSPRLWDPKVTFIVKLQVTSQIPSLKLTYPLKIDTWKRRFLLETIVFRSC